MNAFSWFKKKSYQVEIIIPGGFKDKQGFFRNRVLYAKNILVIFDDDEQNVVFEAISQVEYYITGLRYKGKKNQAVYFCFCNRRLKDFRIYLDTYSARDYNFTYFRKTRTVVITFKKSPTLARDCLKSLAIQGKTYTAEEIPVSLVESQYTFEKADLQFIDHSGGIADFCTNCHNHMWKGNLGKSQNF